MQFTTKEHGFGVLVSLIALTHVPVKGCEPGRGFVPDTEIALDEAAFLSGRDPYQIGRAHV